MKVTGVGKRLAGAHGHLQNIKPGSKCSMSCESKFIIETTNHHQRSGNEYPCDFPFPLPAQKLQDSCIFVWINK